MIPEELSKLKKVISCLIKFICIFGIILVLWKLQPIVWPGGIGIEKGNSISTRTIERNAQGKVVKTIETIKYDDGKTLWDWGSLLGVPLSLAILGYVLQQQQQKRAEKLSEEQRNIADNETKEEVLQTYFDRLSVLLIDKNLIALSNKLDPGTILPEEKELLESSLDVIRARTLSILRRFENDVERKTSVIQFLIEADIVGKLHLDLSEVNLVGINLFGAFLPKARLIQANLSEAKLFGAFLPKADLFRANLSGADLSGADLSGTVLASANLSGVLFSLSNLSGSILVGADFTDANLSGANLSGANLGVANLEDIKWDSNTKWPDKSKFANARNIPEQLKKELGITS